MKFSQALYVFIFFLITNFSFSQVVEIPIPAPIKGGYLGSYIGMIGDKFYTTFYQKISCYDNSGALTQFKYPTVVIGSEKVTVSSFYIKEDKLVGYFLGPKVGSENAHIYIQEFNGELKPIGDLHLISELSNVPYGMMTADSGFGGSFITTYKEKFELDAKYDDLTDKLLITFILHLHRKVELSFGKFILVGDNYTVVNEQQINASKKMNYFKISPLEIFENGDAILSVYEGSDSYSSNASVYTIESSSIIHFPGNGKDLNVLPLSPKYAYVKAITAANNLGPNGEICYGIVSSSNASTNDIALNLFTFHPKTEEFKEFLVESKDLMSYIEFEHGSMATTNNKIWYNSAGNLLICYNLSLNIAKLKESSPFNSVVVEYDKQMEPIWYKKVGAKLGFDSHFARYYTHVETEANKLYYFQNIHPAVLDNGSLKPEIRIADGGSIFYVGTLDLQTKEIVYKRVEYPGYDLRGANFYYSEFSKLKNKFFICATNKGKRCFVPIGFED